jgi:hypothetical protein
MSESRRRHLDKNERVNYIFNHAVFLHAHKSDIYIAVLLPP